jgi:hypothetical protein
LGSTPISNMNVCLRLVSKPVMGPTVVSPELKRLQRGADHSRPTRTEDKNAWSFTSESPTERNPYTPGSESTTLLSFNGDAMPRDFQEPLDF